MATVVTAVLGSEAKPVGLLYVEPERAVVDAGSDTALARSGLEAEFLADLLSACLAHERCGVHLYRSVAGRSQEPTLVSWYEHFGEETLRHVELLEQSYVPDRPRSPGLGLNVLTLQVESAQAAYERALALGIRCETAPLEFLGTKLFFIVGPDQQRIELVEYPPGSPAWGGKP